MSSINVRIHSAINSNNIKRLTSELPSASLQIKNNALMYACEDGKTDIVRFLLDNGTNINFKSTYDEQTPLHVAAGYGHVDTVRLLLERGADRTLKDNMGGYTALGYAKYNQLHNETYAGRKVDFKAIEALYKEIPPPAGARNDGSKNYGRDPYTNDGSNFNGGSNNKSNPRVGGTRRNRKLTRKARQNNRRYSRRN